ncbi:MAG: class I SAM-dependent methyltransferase, partial [Chloroflexota bacterium]
ENSVAVTQQTVTRFVPQPQQASVNVRQASILNESDLASTAPADVVYSWGVLHHTGAMWQAIETAASLVTDDGLFIIAIYNRHVTSPAWHIIKRIYNISPQFIKRLMYYVFYAVIFLAKFAVTGRNPLNKERGMEFSVDVVDWIGGYPYEYASIEEITGFVEKLGFETIQTIPAEVGTGCNEFTFRRKSQHTE